MIHCICNLFINTLYIFPAIFCAKYVWSRCTIDIFFGETNPTLTPSFENFNLITQIPFLNLDYTNFDQYSCPTCKEVSLEAIICLKYWSLYCYHSHSENRLLWKKIQMKTGNGCFFPPLAISTDSLCNKFVRYLKWLVIKVKGMRVLIQYHISQDLAAI